jgi:uncharacterized protein YndB with AHSA1/START domain
LTSIPLEITIDGPVEPVFDLVTEARFWPTWHVLTRSVCGTVNRPFLEGDEFTEYINGPQGTVELTWTVSEYVRGRHVTIQPMGYEASIVYSFEEVPGGTRFSRTVVKDANGSDSSTVTPETEQASIRNLKAFVEAELAKERKGLRQHAA